MSTERSTKGDVARVVPGARVPQAPAPTRSDESKATDNAESNAATDAAKARQLDGDTKHGVKVEAGAGNSRTGVDGLPIR